MFAEFLNIIFKSIKLDKTLYSDNRNFGEAAIYFAGLIMILDGVAGAVAANTVVKTAIGISGLTAIITWFIWAIFIFVIGVKLFPDKQTKVPFKKVLVAVGYAHAPGLLRFFAFANISGCSQSIYFEDARYLFICLNFQNFRCPYLFSCYEVVL